MVKVKKFGEFVLENKKKEQEFEPEPVGEIIDNDFSLNGKVKGILFQQGIADLAGIFNHLEQMGQDVSRENAFLYIKELVKEYMSQEYAVKIDDNELKQTDYKTMMDFVINIISDMHSNQIMQDFEAKDLPF